MLAPVRKPKRCKACRCEFTPMRPLQVGCSYACEVAIAEKSVERRQAARAKAERRDDRTRREKMKRIPDLIREAQREFNAYIRARDAGKPCICCGNPLNGEGGHTSTGGAFDCGHYRSVGSASHLRFDERNAHGQRKACNRYGAGRAVDYRLGLINRLGRVVVEALEADNTPHKWQRDELIAIKTEYAAKRRALLKETV